MQVLKPGGDAAPPDGEDVWRAVERSPEFRDLLAQKRRFIVPATAFFVAYYFALPGLVAFAPEWMERPVFGTVNVAYLFALSQFFMAWILMALYVRRARHFDRLAKQLIDRAKGKGGGS